MESFFIELVKASGKFFFNPLLYWLIFLISFLGYRRVKRERFQFSEQLFPIGSELAWSLFRNLFLSLLISFILFFCGITFTGEIVFIICFVIFVLSFVFGYALLSASFSLGITFFFFKLLTYYNDVWLQAGIITAKTFSGIALLIGIFLLIEARLYRTITNENSYPEIVPSQRGSWIGKYHVQRLSFLPFFVLLTNETNVHEGLFFTLSNLSWDSFQFIFLPFVIGFHHRIYGALPVVVATKLLKVTTYLGLLTLLFASISFYLPGFAFIAVMFAMIGRIIIQYQIMKEDEARGYYFLHMENELKILAVRPHSPAAKLGFQVGDVIRTVNGQPIQKLAELDEILSDFAHYPTFEVLRNEHEIVQMKNVQYVGDRKKFGFIFTILEKESNAANTI